MEYMYKHYIRENCVVVSIVLFVILFGIIQIKKPSCFYKNDGSLREFGIGYKNKTIFPVWLLSLILGLLCYLSVMYYNTAPKFTF